MNGLMNGWIWESNDVNFLSFEYSALFFSLHRMRVGRSQEVRMEESRENAASFYREWSGHPVDALARITPRLRRGRPTGPERSVIWLAGDSSLDNKYWVSQEARACNGFERVLEPPSSKEDVAYWLNKGLAEVNPEVVAINAAIEATTLMGRLGKVRGELKKGHDRFLRDNLRENDTLVVSVGGNDIAMAPSLATIFNMLCLIRFNTKQSIEQGRSCAASHFVKLFGHHVKQYILSLVEKCMPKRIIVCMIYFPLTTPEDSWANTALGALDYDKNPAKLQAAITFMFENATKQIQIEGTQVIPLALGNVLDSSDPQDYVARVEPSSQGGQKMANSILELIHQDHSRNEANVV